MEGSSIDAELQRRIHQQEVAADIGQRALVADDLDEFIRDAAVAVADALDAEYSRILELEPGGDGLLLRQGVGWRSEAVEGPELPRDRNTPAKYVLREEEPVVVDDFRADERFTRDDLLADHDVVSGIAVRIGSIETPWGVLGVFSSEKCEFSDRDATFVRSVASSLASAIDREERERRIEESNRRYRTLVENFPNGSVGLFDEDLRYTAVGGQLTEALGVDPKDRIGSRIPEIYPDAIIDRVEPYFHAALEGERNTFEAELYDRHLLAHTLPVRDETGDVFAGMLVVQDITERKRREQELEQYETIIESVNEGVYVVDADRNFKWVNEAYAEMLGYSREELIGENARMVADDAVIREAEVVEEEEGYEHLPRMDLELQTSTGKWIPVEATSTVLPGGEEDGWFRAGVVRDITERKERERRLEEVIQQLEASNERLEQFAYAASHDLQEPLRMVSSYLQLLEERHADDLDDDAEEFIEFAVDGADRMRAMIDGLLEYSRVESGGEPFEPVDLNQVVEDAMADLELKIEQSGAEITVGDLPVVEGDENQLREVFQNLIDNAIEYSGDGPPRIDVTAEREGSKWRISIADDGIGIDPEQQDRIFEVFQRLHSRQEHAGTGIGLALCRRIVERHGGEIRVSSAPGEGSTFSFTLPASNDRAG